MNEALRDWVTNVDDTFYCIGTVAGPHPYPMMVRDFQSIIGNETREQMQEAEGRLPDSLDRLHRRRLERDGPVPSVPRRHADRDLRRRGGRSRPRTGLHAASIAGGRPGVLHGNRTYLLMDDDGQIEEAHSISAGLDYPGIGPEHAWLDDIGRVKFLSATDEEALDGVPALLAARRHHPGARAGACARPGRWTSRRQKPKDHLMVVNLSGRGDKDLASVAEHLGGKL